MTRILAFIALLLAAGGCAAQAQTGCTVQSQATLLSEFSDNAGAGSITPQNMRNVICSTVNQAGPFAPSAFAGATAGIFTNTQMNDPFTFLLNGISPLTQYQSIHSSEYATEALVGGVAIPNTATVSEGDGIASFVTNNSATTVGVAGLFVSQAKAASTQNFGLNIVMADNDFAAMNIIGAEFDVGCFNVGTACYGINMKSVFPNGTPTTGAAYQASATGSGSPWPIGFISADGGSVTAVTAGAVAAAANNDSQPIAFNTYDNSNTSRQCTLLGKHLTASANLQASCPLAPAQGVTAGGGFAVSPRLIGTCGQGNVANSASSAYTAQTPVTTEFYVAEVFVPANVTVTGVAVYNSGTISGNMKVGLANSSGVNVATSGSVAMSGTTTYQLVPFTGTYAAIGPATYYVEAFYDNNTVRPNTFTAASCGVSKATGQVYATGFTTITPPTTFTTALGPVAGLY